MSSTMFARVTAATASEICPRFNIKKEALAFLRDGMGPAEFVEALIAGKQYLTGIDFMAHALPARDAVWWGCLCLRHVCGDAFAPADRAACQAAVQWVMQPNEQNRAAALQPAHAAGPVSVAGGLAMAVCQTGGSTAQADAPAKTVAGAIKMACTKADAVKIVATQRLFLELARWMAAGQSA